MSTPTISNDEVKKLVVEYVSDDGTINHLRFTGEKPIGKGGFGIVWEAIEDNFGRVAAKIQKRIDFTVIKSILTELYISTTKSMYIIKIKYFI